MDIPNNVFIGMRFPPCSQFTYYSKDEWAEKLPQQGTLTYDDVSGILELLHLKEYIPLDDSKKKHCRAAWFAIYDEILSYLDTDTSVLKKDILVLKKEKSSLPHRMALMPLHPIQSGIRSFTVMVFICWRIK